MSRLNELIQELCPDGVEFIMLIDICKITIGEFVHKNKQTEEGKYPVFNGGKNHTGYYEEFNNDGNKVIISARGANAGYVNRVFTRYWAGNSCYSISPLNDNYLNWLFLYYSLKNEEKKFMGNQQTGSIPAISKKQIEQIKIPVPPLDVQNEIVRILDTFTSHAAELQAELQARKEQYDYYKQFIFKSKISHYKNYLLKNIASFSQGIHVNPSCQYNTMQPGRIRFLRIVDFVSDNEPYRYIERPEDKYIKTEEELIMIRYGASAAGKVFMCHTVAIANNMFKINLNPGILPKYVMYYLSQTSIYTLLNTSGGKSTMPAINFKLVGSINIPIPPLSEQQRIVSILDKFEALVNDLTEGLPAEIAAVQEQYEYYRNKLLTFKDVGTYHGASST